MNMEGKMPGSITSQSSQTTAQAAKATTYESADEAPKKGKTAKQSSAQKLKDSFDTDPAKTWPSVSGLAAKFETSSVHNAQQAAPKDDAVDNSSKFAQAQAFWAGGAKTADDE